jgi:hypothetical protein
MSMSDPEISENSVDEEIPIPEHILNNPEWQELQDPNLRFYVHLGAAFAVKTESGPPRMMQPDVTVSVSGDASNFPETPRVMMRVRINNKQSLKVRAMLSLLPEVLRQAALEISGMVVHGRPPTGEGDTVPIPKTTVVLEVSSDDRV